MRNTNGDQLKEIFLFNITQRYKKKKSHMFQWSVYLKN